MTERGICRANRGCFPLTLEYRLWALTGRLMTRARLVWLRLDLDTARLGLGLALSLARSRAAFSVRPVNGTGQARAWAVQF